MLKIISSIKIWALKNLVGKKLPCRECFANSSVQKILVFRYDRIGDMVVTTPLFKGLLDVFPNATIDVLCGQRNVFVLENNRYVNNKPIFTPTLGGILTLIKLRRRCYDVIVDLNHSIIWRDLLMIRLIKPRWAISVNKGNRYGVAPEHLELYEIFADQPAVDQPRITYRYLDLLKKLGGSPDYHYSYTLPIDDVQEQQVLARNGIMPGTPLWLLNNSGGRPEMRIRDSDLVFLTQKILSHTKGGEDVVMWATTTNTLLKMTYLRNRYFASSKQLKIYNPSKNIMDFLAILKQTNVIITPDTSLVHMAENFNIPSIVIYANDKELYHQWRPRKTDFFRPVFSNAPKSLDGYSVNELEDHLEEFFCYERTRRHSNSHKKGV